MTDNNADKIAKLEAEVAELKAKVDPPKSTFVPMSDAEWRDQMHQMREGRMRRATPPSVVRDMTVIPDDVVKDIVAKGGIRGPS
jgi:hypothetical protein